MSRLAAVAVALGLAITGCAERRLTQIVVVADSDLEVPGQLDRIEIAIVPPEGEEARRMGVLEDVGDLPATLALIHRGGALGPVRVEVVGYVGPTPVVERVAELSFAPDRTLVLELPLETACVEVRCGEDETCAHGLCRPIALAGGEIGDYQGTVPRLGDGGLSCSDRREICNAADDDCDGRIDESIDLEDPRHCGACGNVCPARPHARPACAAGHCGVSCEEGWGDCDGDPLDGCEQALNAVDTCGACGRTCTTPHAAATCFTGSCAVETCAPGWGDCNGDALDGCEEALNQPDRCGGCSACTVPGGTGVCGAGVCRVGACDAGRADCDGDVADGCETELGTIENCGRCGDRCAAPAHGTAACVSGACAIASCEAGWADCDGAAANGCEASLTSMSDCGACGTACALAHGSESCDGGRCGIVACDAGWGDCDGMAAGGCETQLETASDCGACGRRCSGATPICGTGAGGARTCVSACASGLTLCGTGCIDTGSSVAHCGACGRTCAPAHAVPACSGGTCRIASCDPGWGDCNGSAADGCETPLSTLSDCGACGALCSLSSASERCDAGRCVLAACDPGRGNCDANASNGCETDLRSLAACGACGTTCDLPGASETCASGTCAIAACEAGRADCDGSALGGCETALRTLTDCRSCGDRCDLPRATESCASGACTLSACDAGWGDCNGMAADGCERSLRSTTDCGACGAACGPFANATGTCLDGTCTFACLAGWADCNGVAADGCEASLDSSAHCGSCTTACSGSTPICAAGPSGARTCTSACGSLSSCGSACVDLQTDELHCGGCDAVCDPPASTGVCLSGRCGISSCDAGFGDCNGIASDGCEVSLQTDAAHCGSCTVSCSAPDVCTGGACRPA